MTSLLNSVLNALEQIVLEVIDIDDGKVKLVQGGERGPKPFFQTLIINKSLLLVKIHRFYSIFLLMPD